MRELGEAADVPVRAFLTDLYRYPAVDPPTFRAAVTEMFAGPV